MTEHEHVLSVRGDRSGLAITVALHDTTLGPALGGCRLWRYPSRLEAIGDALRLSAAMTMKNALAGLDHGGGKGVIAAPEGPLPDDRRRAALLDFGDLVAGFGGRFISGEDVGTGVEDMRIVRERTPHLLGLPVDLGGTGDPSAPTARGVYAALRATTAQVFGDPSPTGRRITVIGLGHVGTRLARRLATDGAVLTVTDLDPARRALADELGATWSSPGDALTEPADLLVPAGVGGLLTTEVIDRLRVRAVVGPANNPLADPAGADQLHRRGILYAPDFLVNAGGVVYTGLVAGGATPDRAEAAVDDIGARLSAVYAAAQAAGRTPVAEAEDRAAARLRRHSVATST
jgi:leucine dehydrogenase